MENQISCHLYSVKPFLLAGHLFYILDREISKSIISYLLTDADQVKTNTDLILESVQFLASEIKQTQSELKFELCELLTDINQWSGEVRGREEGGESKMIKEGRKEGRERGREGGREERVR